MAKYNRRYKDSVFVDLFGEDKSAKANFLALYNAIHGTHLDARTELKRLRLEQVMYMTFYNDVARLVDDRIIVLIEHQSTVNANMPLRFLQYVARLYEQIQEPKAKYYRTLQKIPTPEFYVFYNGVENYPERTTLKLSDAFIAQSEKPALELVVRVININYNKASEILHTCKPLAEYTLFVEAARRHTKLDSENGFKNAIKECIQNDILREYLQRKSKEVINMLLAEYDYDVDIAVQREEALQEGEEKGFSLGIVHGEAKGFSLGIAQGKQEGFSEGAYQKAIETAKILKRLGDSVQKIMQATGLTEAEIERL